MANWGSYESVLTLVETVASAVLIARFVATGLHRSYRFFVVYLVAFCLQTAVPLVFSSRYTRSYGIAYMLTELAIVFLYVLTVLELYSLVLRDLTGIAQLARRYIRFAIAVAIIVSAVIVRFEDLPDNLLARFFVFERSIVTSLLVFVFLITAFLVRYPIPIARNVVLYTIGYAVYFTTKAGTLLFVNTGHGWSRPLILGLLSVPSVCLLFWIFALNRKGETKPTTLAGKWGREDEQRLVSQIEAINASLLITRKNSYRPERH